MHKNESKENNWIGSASNKVATKIARTNTTGLPLNK